MNTYVFVSNLTGDEVEVDAGGFEEASHIMFGHDGITDPYDYTEYELDSVEELSDTQGWHLPPTVLYWGHAVGFDYYNRVGFLLGKL